MSLSDFFRKTFARQKSRVSQAGQAVVEYILVLVVTVSIVLGILYQFSDAFKGFLDNYFGDYIACLLETGELPSLGGEGPTSSDCNAGFATFSITNGRPAKGSGSNGGDSGESSGNSEDGAGSSDGSSSRSNSGNSRPSRFNGTNSPTNSEAIGKGSKDRPARQATKSKGLDESTGAGSASSDGLSGRRRRRKIRKVIYLDDEYLSEDAKQKKKDKAARGKKPQNDREMDDLRRAQFDLEVPKPKRSLAEEEVTSLSFGALIKFAIIAGILIALFIFLGGQALSIKKSWQKSE